MITLITAPIVEGSPTALGWGSGARGGASSMLLDYQSVGREILYHHWLGGREAAAG